MVSMRSFRPAAMLLGLFLSFVAVSLQAARAADDDTFSSPYQPSADVMGDVDRTLNAARANGKLALIVMGATWCHDSRGLARRFRDPDVAAAVEELYEVLYVDVGFLDQARAVNQRFGLPSIYATPTVMVVDPETETLKNHRTMHIWRDADSISYPDTRAYFEEEAVKARQGVPAPGALLADYYAAIDAFEEREAGRLLEGYDRIGPQLAMGRGNYPEGFEMLWGEVRNFRYKLTDDLLALRAQAEQLSAEGLKVDLVFPTYPPLSWE